MSNENKYERTLMFSTKDDLYFITYNILVVLKFLGCDGRRKFKDVHKLAFMVEFISNKELIRTLDKTIEGQNDKDAMMLSKAYSDGLMRINSVKRVLFTLKKAGMIEFSENNKEVWLNENDKTKLFFEGDYFQYEKENITMLKTRIKRLNNITIDTFLDSAFSKNGVQSWANF
jgi:hypothetical protein